MSSCRGAAVILIAILSSLSYWATANYELTLSDAAWAAWYASKDTVSSGHALDCDGWQNYSSICLTYEKPHENDFMFSYCGYAVCVLLVLGVFLNNKLLVLVGFLGKLAVDIAWPMMSISQIYDSSSFGFFYIKHLTGREVMLHPGLYIFV